MGFTRRSQISAKRSQLSEQQSPWNHLVVLSNSLVMKNAVHSVARRRLFLTSRGSVMT
jgi:hypothetical protein